MDGPGTTTIAAGSMLAITTTGVKALNRRLDNHGTVTWAGTRITGDSSPVFNNFPGALFDIQTDASLYDSFIKITKGPFAYAQLLVTATLDNGETIDATRLAKITPPAFAAATAGLVRPTADGSGDIAVSLAGTSASVSLTVKGYPDNSTVSFDVV